jgi:hypothetical protein
MTKMKCKIRTLINLQVFYVLKKSIKLIRRENCLFYKNSYFEKNVNHHLENVLLTVFKRTSYSNQYFY